MMMMMVKLWQVQKYWHMSVFPKLSVSDYTICWCSILHFLNIYPYLVWKQTACAYQDEIQQPKFYNLLHWFLYHPLHSESGYYSTPGIPLNHLPNFYGKLSIHPLAIVTFFAPSDICGVGWMYWECIHAVLWWRRGPAQYDCIFVHTDLLAEGMHGLDVAWVQAFFSFVSHGITYPCALMNWFSWVGDRADKDMGMWVVLPDLDTTGSP